MKEFILPVLACLILASCKGGGGGGGGSSSGPSLVSHVGTWEGCDNDTDNNISTKYLYLIDENQISEIMTTYGGLNCQSGNEQYTDRAIYTYTRNANSYTSHIISVTSTSLSNADVTFSNTNNYCGFNDWAIGVPKNIAGRNCGGNVINLQDVYSSIFTRSGATALIENESDSLSVSLTMESTLANTGQSLTDGNYAYFDGDLGIFLTLAGGVYSVTYHDSDSKTYYVVWGNYTSSNNTAQFTISIPACGGSVGEASNISFRQGVSSMYLKEDGDSAILLEKVDFNATQFRNSYLESGYSTGCF